MSDKIKHLACYSKDSNTYTSGALLLPFAVASTCIHFFFICFEVLPSNNYGKTDKGLQILQNQVEMSRHDKLHDMLNSLVDLHFEFTISQSLLGKQP